MVNCTGIDRFIDSDPWIDKGYLHCVPPDEDGGSVLVAGAFRFTPRASSERHDSLSVYHRAHSR